MTHLLAQMWLPDAATMTHVAPELALVATLVAIVTAPVLTRRGDHAALIALLGAVACAVLAVLTLRGVADGAQPLFEVRRADGAPGPPMLLADPLSSFFRVFLMVFLAAVIGMWLMFDAERETSPTEFFTLLVASALGMALMTSTTNLLMIIIAIELASLPSYALAGFDKLRRQAAEASVKYVVFGAATSGFMVFGASLLFGMFGSLDVPTLAARLAALNVGGPLLGVALLLLFAGIAFKISAVPFHFWCPDVFEGASLPVATWLSVASKGAGLVLLLRLVYIFAGQAGDAFHSDVLPLISTGIGLFGILTCSFANLAAYRQSNVRRMLAYSSIAHAGYMLMAGAIVQRAAGYESAMAAVVAYLMVYLFMNLGAFMALGMVAYDTGSEDLGAFSGLGFRDPTTAAALAVCLISLVGLPPLAGFYVKWWLLAALGAAAGAAPFMWVLVLAVALNTAVSLYYYARVVWQMYFVAGPETPLRAPLVGKVTVGACALFLVLAGTVWVPHLKARADDFSSEMYAPRAASDSQPPSADRARSGLSAAARPAPSDPRPNP